jgi:hypothetical protein
MRATTKIGATKRLADLDPGDVIMIDLGGHTAVVESSTPDENASMRGRGFYQVRFLMDNGKLGGWTGRADSTVELAPRLVAPVATFDPIAQNTSDQTDDTLVAYLAPRLGTTPLETKVLVRKIAIDGCIDEVFAELIARARNGGVR